MPEPQVRPDELTAAEMAFIRALLAIWPNEIGYPVGADVRPDMGRLVDARIARRRVDDGMGAAVYGLHPEYVEHWGGTPDPWLD